MLSFHGIMNFAIYISNIKYSKNFLFNGSSKIFIA